MPIPSLFILAFSVGVAAAVASRKELRLSPRHPLTTRGFAAYVLFACLTLAPATLYFYAFHGDWALLYAMDAREIPSAVALVGLMLEVGIGAAGFYASASLVRTQRIAVAIGVSAGGLVAAVGAVFLVADRLSKVGSYAQFHGSFGLTPYVLSPVFHGCLAFGAILLGASVQLLVRLSVGGKKAIGPGGPY